MCLTVLKYALIIVEFEKYYWYRWSEQKKTNIAIDCYTNQRSMNPNLIFSRKSGASRNNFQRIKLFIYAQFTMYELSFFENRTRIMRLYLKRQTHGSSITLKIGAYTQLYTQAICACRFERNGKKSSVVVVIFIFFFWKKKRDARVCVFFRKFREWKKEQESEREREIRNDLVIYSI